MTTLESLWALVDGIPRGRVVCYGDLGRAMPRPVSGVLIGKWMTNCPPHVAWWRVVGKDGSLLVAARDPHLALEQRRMLEAEGVEFEGSRVQTEAFWTP